MREHFAFIVTSAVLLILHATFVHLITIGPAVPDLLLIWIVYLAIRRGQIVATLYGFAIGLCVDLIGGGDRMIGLSSLVKSLAGFLAGYFYHENRIEQTLASSRFVLIVGLAALLHYGVYFLIFLRGSTIGWWEALSVHGVSSAMYTTALAIVPMSVFRRKYR